MRYTRLVLLIALAFATGFMLRTATAKDCTSKEVKTIHQGAFSTATDLHVKFWQKEDNIEIVDWEVGDPVGLPPPTSKTEGNQPDYYHTRLHNLPGIPPTEDKDNGKHAVDLTWDNISIPYCTNVRIPFKWTLTPQDNTKHVEVKWTSGGAPKKHGPKNGWRVDPPKVVPTGGFTHRVRLYNMDDPSEIDAQPLYIADLRWGVKETFDDLSYADLMNFTNWTPAPLQALTILPGAESFFDVWTATDVGHILGGFTVLSVAEGNYSPADVLMADLFDHPTPEPVCGILCIAGLALLRRTRR